MPEPKEYEMKTVADFLKVPIEKIDHCLEDFRLWYITYHTIEAAAEYIVKQSGVTLPEAQRVYKCDSFLWIDDNKHNATITIQKAEKAPGA